MYGIHTGTTGGGFYAEGQTQLSRLRGYRRGDYNNTVSGTADRLLVVRPCDYSYKCRDMVSALLLTGGKNENLCYKAAALSCASAFKIQRMKHPAATRRMLSLLSRSFSDYSSHIMYKLRIKENEYGNYI